jgi:hypothetical protein
VDVRGGGFCADWCGGVAGCVSVVGIWGRSVESGGIVRGAANLVDDAGETIEASERMNGSNKKALSADQREELLCKLRGRFEKNMKRHMGMDWAKVKARLEANAGKVWSLNEMEKTGGEPDVIGQDKKTGEIIFCDCSAESPEGRRNLCYDREALDARKKFKPKNSALDLAEAMGIEILTEEVYRELQTLGEFDTKTSSWVKTPADIRELGGALFCDRRYGRVFVYHNGADAYFGGRGFRGVLKI